MNRLLSATLLASAVGVSLAACGDDTGGGGLSYGSSSGGGSSGGSAGDCRVYTTCGSCTPVAGCGWCFSGTSGTCAFDPDDCTSASEFTWTWDPSGCPYVDAGVVPLDAGASPEASHVTFDASPDAPASLEAAAAD
jgi:hypothetical protein